MGSRGAPSAKPRIAVVVRKYGLIGGGEKFAGELTERLSRSARYEFHVFANRWVRGSDEVTFHKVPEVIFPRFLRPLSFAWLADRMIARGGFDLVHSHERVVRADVFTLHSVPHAGWVRDVRRKRQSLFDRSTIAVERRMMSNAEGAWFLPVSNLAADALRREYDIDPERIRVVHPGVDVERFSGPDRAACRAEIRGRYGIGSKELLVLFVGMNFEVKGLDAVIAALAKAQTMKPQTAMRLLVVGRGNETKYAALARDHGVADAVAFAGPVADGVERYYRAADVFAMLSTFDTFGMAVLEAMAAGLPVIVSPNVGAKDLVEDEVNGCIVRAAEDSDAAARTIAAMADAEVLARRSAEAQRTAVRHSWDVTATEVARVYEAIGAAAADPARADGRGQDHDDRIGVNGT